MKLDTSFFIKKKARKISSKQNKKVFDPNIVIKKRRMRPRVTREVTYRNIIENSLYEYIHAKIQLSLV